MIICMNDIDTSTIMFEKCAEDGHEYMVCRMVDNEWVCTIDMNDLHGICNLANPDWDNYVGVYDVFFNEAEIDELKKYKK